MSVVLETRDLHKSYFIGRKEIPVLHGINLSVAEGEFVAVAGPSGCGKSTLLYLLGALTRPTAGSMLINNVDTSAVSDAGLTRLTRENIGFVFRSRHTITSGCRFAYAETAGPLNGR